MPEAKNLDALHSSSRTQTLTEAWDANPNSSQNHFMFGHSEEWFYRGLAGIDFDLSRAPDERITIRPSPVGNVASASASFESAFGTVRSRWARHGDTFDLDVTIPPGATAMVFLPACGSQVVGSGDCHFAAHR